MRGPRAFTLLEVMVAVAILSISLASLFSAQTQTVRASQFIKHVAVASQLARCRMSEIELQILKEGFELAAFGDWEEGPCCELRDQNVQTTGPDPFTCRWKLETVTLPDISEIQQEGGEAVMEGDEESGDAAQGLMTMGLLGPFLPIIQGLLEQAIRKVTVQVVWNEGTWERNVEVVQYLTNPNQGVLGSLIGQTRGENAAEELDNELNGGTGGTDETNRDERGRTGGTGGTGGSGRTLTPGGGR